MPAPYFDYTALLPELILTGAIVVVLVADLLFEEREKYRTSTLAGLGCLGALVPVLYLAGNGADRTMFGGAYMVDNYALVMKALFLVAGYITILLSANYIEEGDYYQGEYYLLLLTALLGMTVMSRPGTSSRSSWPSRRCRSPPTCWPDGASTTPSPTRRRSSTT